MIFIVEWSLLLNGLYCWMVFIVEWSLLCSFYVTWHFKTFLWLDEVRGNQQKTCFCYFKYDIYSSVTFSFVEWH